MLNHSKLNHSKLNHSHATEHVFISEEITKLFTSIDKLQRELQCCWKFYSEFLSYFDNIRIGSYLAFTGECGYEN